MKFKNENGFALADTTIAIAIIVIFTALIASISYNIYLESNFIKRNDTATNYIVELFEYAKTLNFNDIEYETLSTYSLGENVSIVNEDNNEAPRGYKIIVSVTDVHEGFVKQIDITVKYKLASKIKTVSMSTLINK